MKRHQFSALLVTQRLNASNSRSVLGVRDGAVSYLSFGHNATLVTLILVFIARTLANATAKDSGAQVVSYNTIAFEGDAAPSTGQDVRFERFGRPKLNRSGRVAFFATLSGDSITSLNDHGIFTRFGGLEDLVARKGAQVPEAAQGVVFGYTTAFELNDMGQIALQAGLIGSGVDSTNNSGYFSQSDGTLKLVARSGDAAPDTSSNVHFGGPLPFYDAPRWNNAGKTAFFATLTGKEVDSNNDHGIFAESGDMLRLVARAGDPAPGTDPGVVYGSIHRFCCEPSPTHDITGQITFTALLSGIGVNDTNNRGIFSEFEGNLNLVARSGNPAPGTGPGVNFGFLSRPVINDAGETAFRTTLYGDEIDVTNERGVFIQSGGKLRLIARSGDPVQDTNQEVYFSQFRDPILSSAGQVAFLSTLTGRGVNNSNDLGLFVESDGVLGLFAREGDLAPGAGPGVRYGGQFQFSDFMLNDAGQIAFSSWLTGPEVNGSNLRSKGIFATDPAGNLHLIARTGELFDVNPDSNITDYREITFINFGDFVSNSANNGLLAFQLGFADDTEGIFVATISVPEPSSLSLLGISCFLLVGCRCI